MRTMSFVPGVTLALVVLSVSAAAVGCTKATAREAKPPQPVKADAVVMAAAPAGVRYSATIEPRSR
jgi:hypothetical protein